MKEDLWHYNQLWFTRNKFSASFQYIEPKDANLAVVEAENVVKSRAKDQRHVLHIARRYIHIVSARFGYQLEDLTEV